MNSQARRRHTIGLSLIAFMLLGTTTAGAQEVVIGNWESGTPEGWLDWNTGVPQPIMAPPFAFSSVGATRGSGSIQYNLPAGSYSQWLAIDLTFAANHVADWRDDFFATSKVAFDLTLVASEMSSSPDNNFATIILYINAPGYGFMVQPTTQSANETFNPLTLNGTTTRTIVWDVSATHDGNPATGGGEIAPNPSYLQLILGTYSNGGVTYHVDNFRLTNVPEPSSCVLLTLGAAGVVLRSYRRGN